MRKVASLILILSILFTSTAIYANSGPTTWRGYPSSEILAVDENSPIEVVNEDLIFDFTKDENIKHASYSLSGGVTAKYIMTNMSDDGQKVQMAFPFISTMEDFNPQAIDIKVNDESIPFKVYLGREFKNRQDSQARNAQLEFSSILESITSSEYKPRNYDLDQTGRLHIFEVKPKGQDFINIEIEHNQDHDKSRIMSKGFNGYRILEGTESFIAGVYENTELEIYVIGEDIDLDIKAYLGGELREETDDYILDLRTEEIRVRDYLLRDVEGLEDEMDYLHYLADNQIFNLYARTTDELIEANVMNLGSEVLLVEKSMERLLVLIYEVDFQSNASQEVSVSYISRGAMNRRETVDPIYTFDYILNPAENWALFSNLNIQINPPTDNPYIIDSSLELSRREDGVYVGTFGTLPEKDLTFSLYSKEKITPLDKIMGYLNINSYFLMATVPFILVFILGLIITKIYKKFKKL